MAGTDPILRTLVTLKRQQAEKALMIAQNELVSINRELLGLEASLASLDGGGDGLEARLLSHRNGHAIQLINEINACRDRVVQKRRELLLARENVKRVLFSEECLKR